MMILKKGKIPQECEQCEMISVAEKVSWKNDTLHLMYLREVNLSLKRDARGRHFIRNLSKRLFSLATPAAGTAIRVSDYTATREDAKNKSNGHYTSIFRRRTHDHYYYYYLREA